MKELKVTAIKDGTVIDHIASGQCFKVASILQLDKLQNRLIIANNLESKKLGRKGIIKISGLFFDAKNIEKIALVAPNATLSIIKSYKVVEKQKLNVPKVIEGLLRCKNPLCVTNKEGIITKFIVCNNKENPGDAKLKLRCSYCERSFSSDELEIL